MTNPIRELVDKLNAAEPEPIPEAFSSVEKMMDKALDFARDMIIGTNDDEDESAFAPAWAMVTQNGQTVVVMTPFVGGPEAKDAIAEGMRLVMKEAHVIRYTFTSEAWTASQRAPFNPGDLPPSERNDRKEVLMITGGDRVTGTKIRLFDIIRDEDGVVTELKFDKKHSDLQTDSSCGAEGRFTDMLEVARH
jgi:hypothetical protein